MSSKIQTIKDTLAGGYVKPNKDKVDTLVKNLQENSVAQDYLQIKRGLSKETISHFKLGYDVDRNAISIPVFKRGELVNIRYRFIDAGTGQRYSQEKGCEVWLYNEDGISKGLEKGGILIVEGEFDLMSSWQAGFKNVISPASGKDSYGVWIEMLDSIPKVYIAYDNDKPGRTAALNLAERIGIDKCLEIRYPKEIKDANDFFANHTKDDFVTLIKDARPYYKYKFKGLGDIIDKLRIFKDNTFKIDLVPFVEWEDDWIAMVAGRNNSGKTTYVLNIANELIGKDIPTLVLPYERGIVSVGKRFLQIRYEKTKRTLKEIDVEEWDKMTLDSVNLPLYFSTPEMKEFEDTVVRAKRIFNTSVVIIDHLDYFISGKDSIAEQADMIKTIKEIALNHNIIFLIVHQLRKEPSHASVDKKPTRADLVGSGKLSDIPEVVILLHKSEEGEIDVIIDKNKGEMGHEEFVFESKTGVISKKLDEFDSF